MVFRAKNNAKTIQFLVCFVFAQLFYVGFAADVVLGSTLYASNLGEAWYSSDNAFSLRFLPTKGSAFSLGITYGSSITIWKPFAGELDGKSSFRLLSDGNLRLNNGSGDVVWESNTTHLGVSHATLENSGNFVLKKGSVSLWHSFEHLADTLVPSQNFSVGSVLRSGPYSFRLNRNGNLSLKWNDNIMYWTLGLNSSVSNKLINPSLSFQSAGILSLSDASLSMPVVMAYSTDFGEGNPFRFLKLDDDGNLRIYSANTDTNFATVRWTGVSDQCEVYGYCGNMGICSYNATNSPTCSCPSRNFIPVDPNDARQGCMRKIELKDCLGNETVLPMDHTRFFTYPPETSSDVYVLGVTACRLNCLSGTSCVASTILADGTGQCHIKTSNFVSGYQSPTIPGSSFIKVCGPIEPNPPPTLDRRSSITGWKLHVWIVFGLASLSAVLALVIFGGGVWWFFCGNKPPKFEGTYAQYTLLDYTSGTPVHFSYKTLRKATKGFQVKLGSGGFGSVYKGNLSNKMPVAVKRLEGIEQGERQFRMEVATISSTHHLNLVRLIGFCSEGRHRLLVYEFMRNSSLNILLFSERNLLNWDQRFSIALGTARGITYLHEECRECIIHCDIKPENILLDQNFSPKVSDFGLAKLLNPRNQRQVITISNVRGTRGYLAPEWLANLPITSKSDVYSFGMVLLEIVSGRRNFEVSKQTFGKKFTSWAYEEFHRGNVDDIVDSRLGEKFDTEEATRMIQASFWCIQEHPAQRPMMGKVVQMLEGVVEIEKPPPPVNCTSVHSASTTAYGSTMFPSSSSSIQMSSVIGDSSRVDPDRPSCSLLEGDADLEG